MEVTEAELNAATQRYLELICQLHETVPKLRAQRAARVEEVNFLLKRNLLTLLRKVKKAAETPAAREAISVIWLETHMKYAARKNDFSDSFQTHFTFCLIADAMLPAAIAADHESVIQDIVSSRHRKATNSARI